MNERENIFSNAGREGAEQVGEQLVDRSSDGAIDEHYADLTKTRSAELAGQIAGIASRKTVSQNEQEVTREIDFSKIIESISRDLPDIARVNVSLEPQNDIVDYLGKSYVARAEYFRDNPDDYTQHTPKWHQHGIITHSREFARALIEEIPTHLDEWGYGEAADEILSKQIDGLEKRQLLTLAGLLHDVGKFSARKELIEGNTIKSYTFAHHEEYSGKIIRGEDGIFKKLQELGLTSEQIEYIARCAELHFELGNVRTSAYRNGGFSITFVESAEFQDAAQDIINTNPEFRLEIGLLYFADCLSKSAVRAKGDSDIEIERETEALQDELAKLGLNPQLIAQAKQMPVNFRTVKRYLGLWSQARCE